MNGLRLEDLGVWLDGQALVKALTLAIPPGRVAVVMGPSGSGKSSLLAAVGGFLEPPFRTTGNVLVDGLVVSTLAPEQRRIGVLFQEALLFPHLSVGENLAFGLEPRHRGRAERRRIVDAALAEMGLSGFADRDPASLSGGQRARAALMRTLLSAPRALLMDEPFGGLDQPLRAEMRALVAARVRSDGLAALLVTHDPADAEAFGGIAVRLGEADPSQGSG